MIDSAVTFPVLLMLQSDTLETFDAQTPVELQQLIGHIGDGDTRSACESGGNGNVNVGFSHNGKTDVRTFTGELEGDRERLFDGGPVRLYRLPSGLLGNCGRHRQSSERSAASP